MRRAALLAGLAVLLAAGKPARAYVRATAQQSQQPSFWASSCEIVTVYTNGYTGLSSDAIAKSVAEAAHVWSPDMVTCPSPSDGGTPASGHPSFEIIPQMAAGGPVPPIAPDGKNVLVFRTDGWEHGEAIALTSRNTDPSGRIFDADLEVNALPFNDYVWGNLDPNAPPAAGGQDQIDLQLALTHEFGHFLGLGHTCFVNGSDPLPRPVDDQGRPIPDCTADDSIPEAAAVMWWQVRRDSTSKRALTIDDQRGVCAIYPPNAAVPACAANVPDNGCSCRTAGTPRAAGGALFGLAVLLMARRRRR